MAAIQLQQGERLIGQGMMAYWEPVWGHSCDTCSGTVFVTTQRVCFCLSMLHSVEFELALSEIRGFATGRHLFFTKVVLYDWLGKTFTLTGFPVKKLQGWLKQAGVQKIGE